VVVDKGGRNNFDTLETEEQGIKQAQKRGGEIEIHRHRRVERHLGKIHLANQASGHGEEIDFGIKNQILRNVKTGADLSSLGLDDALARQNNVSSDGDADVDLESSGSTACSKRPDFRLSCLPEHSAGQRFLASRLKPRWLMNEARH
jgi:hypothetical protein